MRNVDMKPIKSSELSPDQLDAVCGGALSLTGFVQQMLHDASQMALISDTLKNMADTQKAIINNLP